MSKPKATEFWKKYQAGKLSTLSAFRKARREQIESEEGQSAASLGNRNQTDLDLERLRGKHLMSDESMLRLHEKADWQNTDENIQRFAAGYIEAARKHNVPLYVHCAFRTPEEQQEMFRKGRSKAQFPRAAHCQGVAVDIVHGKFHWDLTKDEWRRLGIIGLDVARQLSIPITWGGNWSFYDPAHWELTGWKDHIKQHIAVKAPEHYTPRALLRV